MREFYNMDCMEGMKDYPDNFFDLAIVDPPYGGGAKDTYIHGAEDGRFGNKGSRFEKYRNIQCERSGGQWASKYGKNITEWDVAPTDEYFAELKRISKNQIIWGGIISGCHRQGVSSFGENSQYPIRFQCLWLNMRGLHLTVMQKCLNMHHRIKRDFTPHKSQ